MLKIRDFARLAEVSLTTLRYYDEIGLLKPIYVDPETGYRFYTMDQLPHLHRILAFKELGLGLIRPPRKSELTPQPPTEKEE
jgi:DNA-binding transcriptional MerR regulator